MDGLNKASKPSTNLPEKSSLVARKMGSQSPRFTKATKGDQFADNGSVTSSTLVTCGWSKQGLQTFNKLAREIFISHKEDGEDFNKTFKEHIEQEMASTNKTSKRKRNCIETYNDLNEEEMKQNYEDQNVEENEGWVARNLFIV